MIFDNDYTSLNGGALAIPMAEGYDCSYGTALALVESARNDYIMFNAMMNVEARAASIMRESTGVIREGEIMSLQEASIGGIWNKIKELFTKLLAKIKAILHTFISKIDSLFKTDKQLVKKYSKEVLRKTNIGNLNVKWRKDKSSIPRIINNWNSTGHGWAEESDKRRDHYIEGCTYDDLTLDEFLEDEEELEIKEIDGGIRGIINYFENSNKKLKELELENKKAQKTIETNIKTADTEAKNAADNAAKNPKDASAGTTLENANKAYEMGVAYQDAVLKIHGLTIDVRKTKYKYHKAAFMKAVAANDKKLEENALYLDYVAEEAAEEVEDVIQGAIDSNAEYADIMSSSNASDAVLDSDVSDDPDKNIADYGKGSKKTEVEKYEKDSVDGTVDTDYNGKESAFFSRPLW